jgi:osmotically inducible protein OsmC
VARAERTADVVWEGDLVHGSGTIVSTGSGALGGLPVSWQARTEESGGKTSPEELIAAAHAACLSMALSSGLAKAGTPPERLETHAVCTFEQVEGGWAIKTMELTVRGRVPGIDEAAFGEAVKAAKEGCPVSGALKGNVEITVQPQLLDE